MPNSRMKNKGPAPPESVEEFTVEDLEGFSVEDLLAGVQDLPDDGDEEETFAAAPAPFLAPPAPAPAFATPAQPAPRAQTGAWGAPAGAAAQTQQAPPSWEARRQAPPLAMPTEYAPPPSMHSGNPDYRTQLDLVRHEMAQLLARQFDDIDHRFAAVMHEMRGRLDLSEKTLHLTEEALQKREEEIARLRKENALYRKKLKELAEVRNKLDEVFGG